MSFDKARFHLPVNHEPAMEVPESHGGGAVCFTCVAYSPEGGRFGSCLSPDYHRYYGTRQIPKPPTRFCSDWYTPVPELLGGDD